MDGVSNSPAKTKVSAAVDNYKILVVDDEEGICLLLEDILKDCGYNISFHIDPRTALAAFRETVYPVVISDIRMPGMDGMQLMQEILAIDKNTSVIMITAYGSIENAVTCMEKGAFNYITKPFKSAEIVAIVKKAVERVNLIRENIFLKRKLKSLATATRLVGKSAKMAESLKLAEKLAQTNFKVLITGESGTGKELFARYIHDSSSRVNSAFIPVQCSLLPESLLESELFGHKKGSFTGAATDKKGLFEEAEQGTIFLDEIGDINLNVQSKLLRFLQEKEIKPIGELKSRIVDVRLIFATNKDLQQLVAAGQFREDLYYRIKEVELRIPPLRERREDIPLLVRHFLPEISRELGSKIEVETEIFNLLMSYEWSGNVRELRNCLTNAAAVCEQNLITTREISGILLLTHEESMLAESGLGFSELRKKVLREFDRKYIINFLAKNRGNITRTAAELKIDKKNLWIMLRKYGIDSKMYK